MPTARNSNRPHDYYMARKAPLAAEGRAAERHVFVITRLDALLAHTCGLESADQFVQAMDSGQDSRTGFKAIITNDTVGMRVPNKTYRKDCVSGTVLTKTWFAHVKMLQGWRHKPQ